MDYDEYDEESQRAWAKGSMNFNVSITNAQEDFFVREVADRMADKVSKEMIKGIEQRAHELIETKVLERLEEVISDVIEKGLTKELQPSDEFSTPKGVPVTPLEFIAKGAESFLQTPVDGDGHAVTPGAYSRGKPRIHHYMQGVITRQFEDEIGKEVKAMKSQIRDQMKNAAAEWLAKFQAETVTGVENAKALQLRT